MSMLRTTPLFALRDEGMSLTPALWYALGVAGMIHAFAEPSRLPLRLLAGQASLCPECNPHLLSEGLAMQLDLDHLSEVGINLMRVVVRTALHHNGLGVEFHTEPRLHLAVWVEDCGKVRGMNLPTAKAAEFHPNELAAAGAHGGGVLSLSSRPSSSRSARSSKRSGNAGKTSRAAS